MHILAEWIQIKINKNKFNLQTAEIVCNTRESNKSECSVGRHEDDDYGYTLREVYLEQTVLRT
jgi:hypothetical protein